MIEVRKVQERDFHYLYLIKPSFTKETLSQRLHFQQKGEIEFLILLENSHPICFAVLSLVGKATHPEYPDLYDVYTRETYRGQGYASILIQKCEERVKELGYRQIGLAVNPTLNPKAKSLYEKLGYRSTNEEPYLDGVYDATEDWVVDMVKELTLK